MNSSLALLLLACLVKIAVAESDPEKAWENFKAQHGKQYSPQGEAVRKSNFLKAHSLIENHNKGKSSFKLAHNHLSDKTSEELAKLCGEKSDAKVTRTFPSADGDDDRENDDELEIYSNRQSVPASYDLRTATKCVGPVKNQGSCGSCWSFSAVASLEYARCNKTGSFVALSEQMLVDCDTNDFGCDGGYPAYSGGAWVWMKNNNKGIQTQTSYPYTGVRGTCKYNTNSLGAKGVNTYGGPVAKDVKSIQNAILAYGLVRASVYVADNAFYYYTSGAYATTACSTLAFGQTNHAVNIVGWATVNGVDTWIMRNSWGSGWGTGGYMNIKRGVNMCNIESKVGWVTVNV